MKILLTGNTFHGYDIDLLEAIIESGHEVKAIFNNIHGPFNQLTDFYKKMQFGILPNKFKINYFRDYSVDKYNKSIETELKNNEYDLLLVIGAKTFKEEVLNKIKIPKVLWFMDGVKFYQNLLPKFKLFDALFLFEPTDIDVIKEKTGIDAHLLNLGFSAKRFFPINTNKEFDYSFIGSYYDNRDDLLKSIVKEPYKGIVIGDFKRSNSKSIRDINLKQQIAIKDVNLIFNQSRININIHHKQSIEGLNVRSFEIMGSGNIQFLDWKKLGANLFTDGEDCIFYNSKEEFSQKLDFYLRNQNLLEGIQKKAHQLALNNHTWKHRIDEMFAILKSMKVI